MLRLRPPPQVTHRNIPTSLGLTPQVVQVIDVLRLILDTSLNSSVSRNPFTSSRCTLPLIIASTPMRRNMSIRTRISYASIGHCS